jgi:FkbM family methyltransferase
MNFYQRLRRTLAPIKVGVQYLRHLDNGWEVWRAVRAGRPVTRLAVRRGPVIHARPQDPATFVFEEIFVGACYEPPGFPPIEPGQTVVDLGANIGVFTLRCQFLAPGVRVHAVEPDPSTFAQLQENVRRNGLEASVTTHHLAISDSSEPLFLEPTDINAHRSLSHTPHGDPIPAMALDAFFAHAGIDRCDLLKIDTEGAEIAIIEGASRDFWPRVDRLAIEYHHNDTRGTAERLRRYLEGLGYQCEGETNPAYSHGLLFASRRHK